MKSLKELEEEYKKKQRLWKMSIRLDTNKFRRFWKWVWYFIAFPFVWLFYNMRDWRTFIIFIIVFLVVSIEVWLPYLLGAIFWNNESFRITMFSIGSACWLFWLGPFTPFLPLCIFLTFAIKGLMNKIKDKKHNGKLGNTPKK